jgi:hypothetical protein
MADQTTVFEQRAHLFRCGVGCHIEILGLFAQQDVPDASTHKTGTETGFIQPV